MAEYGRDAVLAMTPGQVVLSRRYQLDRQTKDRAALQQAVLRGLNPRKPEVMDKDLTAVLTRAAE